MLSNQDIVAEFEALAQKYELPKEGGTNIKGGLTQLASNYIMLQIVYVSRKRREFFTPEEIRGDFSALEEARMLKQLERCTDGKIGITIGGTTWDYLDPMLIQDMKDALQCILHTKVERRNGGMLISKGYGGGFTGSAQVIPYPEGYQPQQEKFTPQELDLIIRHELAERDKVEKMKGKKIKHSEESHTCFPELGKLTEWLLHFVPEDWGTTIKMSFVYDFMYGAGFLDFRGKAWLEDNSSSVLSNHGKMHMIKDWLKAYGKNNDMK